MSESWECETHRSESGYSKNCISKGVVENGCRTVYFDLRKWYDTEYAKRNIRIRRRKVACMSPTLLVRTSSTPHLHALIMLFSRMFDFIQKAETGLQKVKSAHQS